MAALSRATTVVGALVVALVGRSRRNSREPAADRRAWPWQLSLRLQLPARCRGACMLMPRVRSIRSPRRHASIARPAKHGCMRDPPPCRASAWCVVSGCATHVIERMIVHRIPCSGRCICSVRRVCLLGPSQPAAGMAADALGIRCLGRRFSWSECPRTRRGCYKACGCSMRRASQSPLDAACGARTYVSHWLAAAGNALQAGMCMARACRLRRIPAAGSHAAACGPAAVVGCVVSARPGRPRPFTDQLTVGSFS